MTEERKKKQGETFFKHVYLTYKDKRKKSIYPRFPHLQSWQEKIYSFPLKS